MDPLQVTKLIALSTTAAVAGFTAAVLLAHGTQRRDQAVFLALFLLLYALFKANDAITMTGGYAAAPILAVVTTPVRFLLGPAIFFYARSMTSPRPEWLRPRDALALLWPAAAIVAIIPFILMSPEDKNGLMAGDFRTEDMRTWFLFTCKVITALFLSSVFLYLAAAFRLLLRHGLTIRRLFSNLEDRSLRWLRLTLLVLAAGWTWTAITDLWAIQGGRPSWIAAATPCVELGWIGAIAFFGMVQRPVFEDDPALSVPEASASARYARSALGHERMARIADNLDQAMRRDALYKDPNLSLRSLSDHLGVSEHYLSQTLNDRLGETFFDYVNRHRIAEAGERLESTDEPIVAIAHALGYNSRSTFNAAFKRYAGMTPSAFRRRAKTRPQGASAQSFS